MKLVIDRAKWLRGEGSSTSRLLRPSDKKMCCLGFYGIACKVSEDSLMSCTTPDGLNGEGASFWLWTKAKKGGAWLFSRKNYLPNRNVISQACQKLMKANDNIDLPEANREQEIADLFFQHGVEVEFVG
jgi:hypothetical protein